MDLLGKHLLPLDTFRVLHMCDEIGPETYFSTYFIQLLYKFLFDSLTFPFLMRYSSFIEADDLMLALNSLLTGLVALRTV